MLLNIETFFCNPKLDNYKVIITVKRSSQLFIRYCIEISGHVLMSFCSSSLMPALQCLTCTFWYLHVDLGLCVYAMTVTEKLMLILEVCRVDRSHSYFLKKIWVKEVFPIYEYVR